MVTDVEEENLAMTFTVKGECHSVHVLKPSYLLK